MIPAGIHIGETEFFRENGHMLAMHNGHRSEVHELPEQILQVIDTAITPARQLCLDQMGILCKQEQRLQVLKCLCSAYDFTPDILDGRLFLQLEYTSCAFRGDCRFEGKFCSSIMVEGNEVTMAELRVTSLVRAGLRDDEICYQLDIHPQTLRVQKASAQRKLNADRKVGIAMKAVQYGIEF